MLTWPASFYFLGLLSANWIYDFNTLFNANVTTEMFENSITHYKTWAEIPRIPLHVIHAILGLGFIGSFIKIYKPSEDAKYFEYGTLGLYLLTFCVYLTNLRTGAESAVSGNWGDVDSFTGVNVLAASQIIMIILLFGVIMLQCGLYYGEWEYQNRLAAFNKELEEEKVEESKKSEEESKKEKKGAKASATGAERKAGPKQTAPIRSKRA